MHLIKMDFSGTWTSICSVAQKITLGKMFLFYLEINIFLFRVFKIWSFKDGITYFLSPYDDFLQDRNQGHPPLRPPKKDNIFQN